VNVFIDTSAWVAVETPKDKNYIRAENILKDLIKNRYFFIMTDYIYDETITELMVNSGNEDAIKFGEKILKSSIVEMVIIDKEDIKEALELKKKYKDKDFSFTDCTSFVIMKRLGITKAFSFDKHFEQAGFEVLR
jgi:predicted nucleic acid-binding protein